VAPEAVVRTAVPRVSVYVLPPVEFESEISFPFLSRMVLAAPTAPNVITVPFGALTQFGVPPVILKVQPEPSLDTLVSLEVQAEYSGLYPVVPLNGCGVPPASM
jgi:hypothetical protein